MHKRRYKFRLGIVTLNFTFVFILISSRIIYYQGPQHDKLLRLAQDQHSVKIELEPRRGSIVDRNMRELAVNLKVSSVFAIARDVKEKKRTAELLAPILDKEVPFLLERLSRDKLFVWLARKITTKQAEDVKKLGLKGIDLIDETKRFYPNASLASHVIGFCGTDNIGLEGIESRFNKYMQGDKGYKAIVRDAKRREIHAYSGTHIPPVDGNDLVLTIDQVIQHITEKALAKYCKKYRAKAGAAIVMDPYNGDILALAVQPSYDLNEFFKATEDVKRNRAICDYYEPGSAFKVITASACLNEKSVDLEDNFFCENGSWYIAGHTLHDHRGHGNLTFRQVIEKSSNIGTVKAAIKLGEKSLYKYVKAYGFGSVTGIDLDGEIAGVVRPLDKWTKYSITAIPMGHEIGVTPIQMARAMSVIANGGLLVKPRIIKKIIDAKGETIREYKPTVLRRIISEDTSDMLKDILSGVVERGTGKNARLKEYTTAGKTGTSQKIVSGKYSHSKYVASFAGFAPANDPRIVIYVMADEPPKPTYYGGTVAAPVFNEIAKKTLPYLGIKPDKKKILKKKGGKKGR
ncbi:peptidoglycan D,D-transpeptidase FtsI family protein [Candidatus Omnitrophota bacterium]